MQFSLNKIVIFGNDVGFLKFLSSHFVFFAIPKKLNVSQFLRVHYNWMKHFFKSIFEKRTAKNFVFYSLVFKMVEAEEEYTEQMEVLVSCFLRPFKMAASSKNPPCNHEDVNSIFLNSETVLFLHQIFLKGLTSRMESWPTLVLGGW